MVVVEKVMLLCARRIFFGEVPAVPKNRIHIIQVELSGTALLYGLVAYRLFDIFYL